MNGALGSIEESHSPNTRKGGAREEGEERESINGKEKEKKKKLQAESGRPASCKVTIVRSYSMWSAGLAETEDGIHEAYNRLIAESKHFIYIENQFFVSACGDCDNSVINTIANSLFSRILKANRDGDIFRVIVTMPLFPGINGQLRSDGLSSIGCVMHFQFRTICWGKNSLYGRLRQNGIDPDDYIFFTGLRTHAKFESTIETEMIYIHSKLMIIDDVKAVIGSANINDRSMTGYKDSEICMIVEDTAYVESLMDGRPYSAGEFSLKLRMKAWGDNMGLKAEEYGEMQDPVCEEFWDKFKTLARTNAQLYEKAFPKLIPTNRIQKLSQIDTSGGVGADLNGSDEEGKKGKKKKKKEKRGKKGSGKSETVLDTVEEGGEGDSSSDQSAEDDFTASDCCDDQDLPSVDLDLELELSNFENGADSHQRNRSKSQLEVMMEKGGGVKSTNDILKTLSKIKGFLVEYPLDFLKDDIAKLRSPIAPTEIFK